MMLSFLRFPLLAVLVAGPLLLQAQSAPAPAPAWQKSIGLHFTPTLGYRTLQGDGDAAFIADIRDDQERPCGRFDAGARLRLTRGAHLRLEAGLDFASRGYRRRPTPYVLYDPDPAVPQYSSSKYRYQFLSLPLQASYAFGRGRLQGFVGGGVSLDLLLGLRTENTYYYADGHEQQQTGSTTGGLLRGNLTPRLTAGLRYALTPTYAVELAPVVQYSLLPSVIHASVREHLYSGGVTVAVYRNI